MTKIIVPKFQYRGRNVPRLLMESAIVSDKKPKAPFDPLLHSRPLSDILAFYEIERDLECESPWKNDANKLPERVKFVAKKFMDRVRNKWIFAKDAYMILPNSQAPPGMETLPGQDYVLAKYFKSVKGFEENHSPTGSEKEVFVWLPYGPGGCGGYVIPTRDGVYNPITGTPFATEFDVWKAQEIWESWGFSKPRWVISKFYRNHDENEIYPVIFASSPGESEGGPATILLNKSLEMQERMFKRKFVEEVTCHECFQRRYFQDRIIGSFAAKQMKGLLSRF
jgi:hypothetical protein